MSLAETARFPTAPAEHFDVMFTEVQARLGSYLRTAFGLPAKASAEAAQRLLAQILYPRLFRALFGVDALADRFDGDTVSPDFDLKPVRKAVAELIESLPQELRRQPAPCSGPAASGARRCHGPAPCRRPATRRASGSRRNRTRSPRSRCRRA